MARVHVVKETTVDPIGGSQLFFQWCRFALDEGEQFGYRFIWRRPSGELQAARGQTRLPSVAVAQELMAKAVSERWGQRDGDEMLQAAQRLRGSGLTVDLATGYVGWPDAESARAGYSTPEMNEDAKLISDWT